MDLLASYDDDDDAQHQPLKRPSTYGSKRSDSLACPCMDVHIPEKAPCNNRMSRRPKLDLPDASSLLEGEPQRKTCSVHMY